MNNQIIHLISHLHNENTDLKDELKNEKQKRQFISTTLSDARYTIRSQKVAIAMLEKKNDRLRARRKKRWAKLFRIN